MTRTDNITGNVPRGAVRQTMAGGERDPEKDILLPTSNGWYWHAIYAQVFYPHLFKENR